LGSIDSQQRRGKDGYPGCGEMHDETTLPANAKAEPAESTAKFLVPRTLDGAKFLPHAVSS
jgi:hypothetical protein